MSSYEIYSHPDVLLYDHLKRVGDFCYCLISEKDIDFSYDKHKLCYIMKIIGYTHDIGKANKYFQDYLKQEIRSGKSNILPKLRTHSFLSALVTYLQIKDIDEKLALIGYIIVKSHHGSLKNFNDEYLSENELNDVKKNLKEQINNLPESQVNDILNKLELKSVDSNMLIDLIDTINKLTDNIIDLLEDNSDFESYIIYKLLFSALIFADKEDAIFHNNKSLIYDIPNDLVKQYRTKHFKLENKKLNVLRNELFEEVLDSIHNSNLKIMSLTAPTGTGKTLTAIAAALELRSKLNKNMSIIYSLPFTSIIDQNYEVYYKVLSDMLGCDKVSSDKILKHHHFSEFKYENEFNNYDCHQSKFLIESWNSEIVVTTFIQLFNTLFSNQNRFLVRYQKLVNSIIILDEVQSIPYKYWLVIREYFKSLSKHLNLYFIFVTATQPLIFSSDEIFELVPNKKNYFSFFHRNKMYINLNKISLENFFKNICNIIQKNNQKSVLIILNTIKSAQMTYDFIKELKLDDTELFFLSTHIIPRERKERIKNIRDSNKRKIIVSTQLIEAGVDIDLDIVIRDLAPLDSINQSAGRCNRENRGNYLGEVYVYNIANEKGIEYHKMIYCNYLIDKTKIVLNNHDLILEEQFFELNQDYYHLVSDGKSNDISRDLIRKIFDLRFENVTNDFQLIEDQDMITIFIEVDDNAKLIWSKYQKITNEKDLKIKNEQFNLIKSEFYEYVINVFRKNQKCDENILYIKHELLDKYYNYETGYIIDANR